MKQVIARLICALSVLLLPYVSNGQQVEAPAYKDGDWWVFKIVRENWIDSLNRGPDLIPDTFGDVARIESGLYEVRYLNGTFKVYYLDRDKKVDQGESFFAMVPLINKSTGDVKWLDFPLSVGSKWTFRYYSPTRFRSSKGGWWDATVEDLAVEDVSFMDGRFSTHKIQRIDEAGRASRIVKEFIYFYSPETKSVVRAEIGLKSKQSPGPIWRIELMKSSLR